MDGAACRCTILNVCYISTSSSEEVRSRLLWWVCLSVCLYVYLSVRVTGQPIFTKFLCMFHVTKARSSSSLTALWYDKYFRICGWHVFMELGQWARVRHDVVSIKFTRWWHQLDVKQLVFSWVHQNAAQGTTSVIYDCPLAVVFITDYGEFRGRGNSKFGYFWARFGMLLGGNFHADAGQYSIVLNRINLPRRRGNQLAVN